MRSLIVTVDFNNKAKYDYVKFVQNDSESCQIVIDFSDSISGKTVVLNAKLPDGTSYEIDMTVVSDKRASLTLPTDILSQPGIVECQVAIYQGTYRLTDWSGFSYKVVSDLSAGAEIEISDNYPVLTTLIGDVQGLMDTYQAAEDSRDGLYETAEIARDNLYDSRENNRDTEYDTAEGARDILYQGAEGARDGLYQTAEDARDTLYQLAEDARDALVQTINNNAGDLTALNTIDKTSLVNAINELWTDMLVEDVTESTSYEIKLQVEDGKPKLLYREVV